ncbi:MAG: MGMT family protein [Sphingomonadales bacterium]|nr:MGMT family protein [Sphingomonadales bacterium]
MSEPTFYEKVYEVVRLVPPGRVTSYGAIAKFLGAARSSRLVGWAMNVSHGVVPPVPAHRVVNRQGLLSGKAHFGDVNAMELRLTAEGVEVVNDQIQHFDRIFWDPEKELTII